MTTSPIDLLGDQGRLIEGKFSKTADIECFHNSDGEENDGGKDVMQKSCKPNPAKHAFFTIR
jgi:hypothetical protein